MDNWQNPISDNSPAEVNLSRKGIDAKKAIAIAKALETNNSITTIDLSGNSIGAEGAAAVAKSIERNNTMATIVL